MHALAIVAVFVVAFAVRWATLNGMSGDDHASLPATPSYLHGDWPVRDFSDSGDPLYGAMSALAQAIVGYRAVGEVILGTSLIAFSFAVAFHLAWRASRSLLLTAGLIALALLLITQRNLYAYVKMFVFAPALWLCWRYIDRPTLVRSVVLAFGVAIAFLYRHDLGAYAGMGAAAAILASHRSGGARSVVRASLRFGVFLVLWLAPFLGLVQTYEGLVPYFQSRLAVFGRSDSMSRQPVRFSVDPTAPSYWFRIEPPQPARVFVEWKPEVSPGNRVELEHKYALTDGKDPRRRLYEYYLTDVSRPTLLALLTDSRIIDRRGLITVRGASVRGSRVPDEPVANERPPSDAPLAARARAAIQWSPTVTDADRVALERQYGLLDPEPGRNRWEYTLTRVNSNNIRAIVDDGHVYDTGMIDRTLYRPMEESWVARMQRSNPLFRIRIAPRYVRSYNAGIALYYVSFALPYALFIMLIADAVRGVRRGRMPNAPEKIFAAAVMMAVVHVALLRRMGYFADHVAVAAVMGACLFGHAFSRPGAAPPQARIFSKVAACVILLFVTFATLTYATPVDVASRAGMDQGVRNVWDKSVRAFRSLSVSPPIDEYAPRDARGDKALIRYIYECTRPDDLLWLISDLFTFPYYTERRVVGHIHWMNGLLMTPAYERRTIETVDKQEVPIVLSVGARRPLEYLEPYPLLHEYVAKRYTSQYAIPEDKTQRGGLFWLLTDGRRKPTGTYELLGLPCFK